MKQKGIIDKESKARRRRNENASATVGKKQKEASPSRSSVEWKVIVLIAAVLGGVIFLLFEETIREVVQRNFSEVSIAIFVSLIMFLFVVAVLIRFLWKNAKHQWIIWTAYIWTAFVLLGIIMIDMELGAPTIHVSLNNATRDTQQLGELKCPTGGTKLLVGASVLCETKPQLNNVSAQFMFVHFNGSPSVQSKDNLYFVAPPEVRHIFVYIHGYDEKGTEYDLSTGTTATIPTYNEDSQRRAQFIAFILGLLGIASFSVPALMVNLKILKEEKEGK